MNIDYVSIRRNPSSEYVHGYFPNNIESFPGLEINIHYGKETLVYINFFEPLGTDKTEICNIICDIEEKVLNINSHLYKISYIFVLSERLATGHRFLKELERFE